jgi:DnaJ-class molecular chaperone
MPANPPTNEKVPVPCDRCRGTGINVGIECSECGGKGHRVMIGGNRSGTDESTREAQAVAREAS